VRVAIVSPEFPPNIGGVETYAGEYVSELARRGHEITVFTVPHARGEESIPGVIVRPVLRLCRGADRRTLSAYEADTWHVLNAAYSWLAFERPRCLVTVHGNDFLEPYYPIAQPDLGRLPIAWRWFGASSRHLRPVWIRLSRGVVQQAVARASHVFANSRYTDRALLQTIPECQGRTSVAYVGVGAHFFDVVHRPRTGTAARLLTVSRLSEPRKNVDSVLRALARLLDRHAFHYTIVGDGWDRPRLEQLARELGLADRVRFTGFVDRGELLDLYADADLMVLASAVMHGSHEGFGIVYLEAAASGVPSLAARLAGAAEAVEEGVSGMFVEEPTVEALAGALDDFLAGRCRFDPDACRDFASRFTWARVVDHCLQFYTAEVEAGVRKHESG
jgi:phosphatidylinositol alpha-1,6-mannosyltransferase